MTSNARVLFFLSFLGLLAWLALRTHAPEKRSTFKKQPVAPALNLKAQIGVTNSQLAASLQDFTAPAQKSPAKMAQSQDPTDSLRTQARQFLLRLYGAQKAFWAEHGRYTTDLTALGIRPPGLEIPFKFGFLKPFHPEELLANALVREDPSRTNSDHFLLELEPAHQQRYAYVSSLESLDLSQHASACHLGCTASEQDFEVLLVYPTASGKVEVWTVSGDRRIDFYK